MTVGKALTLLNGTIRQGGTALTISGNDVVVDGTAFDGGNQTIKISGDRAVIRGAVFANMRESSIRLIPGADGTLIDAITLTQTVNTGATYSPIAANDNNAGVGTFKGLTIRNSAIDQGPAGIAHFGIEVWGVSNLLISGNDLRGASALISIPRSDGAIVEGNTFGGDFFWGAEFADISGAKFRNNTIHGNGRTDGIGRAVVQLNPGSGTVDGIEITGNHVDNENALLNAAGSNQTITDNCGGWNHLYNVTGPAPAGDFVPPVNIARNGACP